MLNILRTFQLGFHRFFSLYYVPRGIVETATWAPPQLHKTPPNTRESCSRCSDPCRPPHKGFSHETRQARNWGDARAAGPGADITAKAQMTPHFTFVHRNESWNNSFILHYWQRTILTLTLMVCSNARISCHCLKSAWNRKVAADFISV